jgi:mono/diheme cytochrome c family protein
MKKQKLILMAVLLGSFAFMSMNLIKTTVQEPWEVPAKYEKMKNPYADVADAEKIGRVLYSKHCKSCHGTKGEGDGPKAEELDTEMPSLTTDAFKKQSDGAMYYKTYEGRDDMPSFIKKIADEKDQWLLINYIKGL